MMRSRSSIAQNNGFKVSTNELTKVLRAPMNRTIHRVFTIRSSRLTRSKRRSRMLELTPVSEAAPKSSIKIFNQLEVTTTTCLANQAGTKKNGRQEKISKSRFCEDPSCIQPIPRPARLKEIGAAPECHETQDKLNGKKHRIAQVHWHQIHVSPI